jgi:hypothetical protein
LTFSLSFSPLPFYIFEIFPLDFFVHHIT